MARIRTIKPEFFTSLTINELSLTAQRTFIGLWTYADDYGRGVDDPRLIKAAIWPLVDSHTPTKVERDLAALAELGLIRRYEVDGSAYFQILGWAEHQRVNRPSDSRIPLPPAPDGSERNHGDLSEGSPPERKGKELGNEGKEEIPAQRSEGSNPKANGNGSRNGRLSLCDTCESAFNPKLGPCPKCSVRVPDSEVTV